MPIPIVQTGHPVLRKPAQQLTKAEIVHPKTRDLIEAMRETMYAAPGVGLAAPQIGLDLHIAVLEDREDYLKDVPQEVLDERSRRPVPFQVVINPVLKPLVSDEIAFFEGCLSVAGFTALVSRYNAVEVTCLNEQAEEVVIRAEGWHARILQHEIDHLNGMLYIDRMETRSFTSLDNMKNYWNGKSVDEVRAALNLA